VEKNVPEIRFKGFSGNWVFKTISELINEEILYPPKDGNHGDIHPKATDYVKYGIPFIMANNIRDGAIQFYNCNHIRLSQAETLQKGFAKSGDVLLTHKGTVGEVAVIPSTEFPYLMLTPQVTYYRIFNANLLDTNFLATSFITNNFQAPLKSEAGGGTRAYIGITAQQNLGISIPPEIREQSKIGNTFQKLDSLINQQQQKHDKLSNIKKAMLEKMFPKQGETIPEIRFKGFSGAWEEKRLCEAAPLRGGFAFQSFKFSDSGIPIVKISNILPTGEVGGEFNYFKEINNDENYLLLDGSALLAMSGATTGKVSILKSSKNSKFYQNQRVGYFQRNIEFNYLFISTLVRSHIFKDKLDAVLVAGAQPNVSSKEIDSFEFMMPSDINEQTKIGNYFQKLDTLINQHQQQITKLNNIKQACLSKMFV